MTQTLDELNCIKLNVLDVGPSRIKKTGTGTIGSSGFKGKKHSEYSRALISSGRQGKGRAIQLAAHVDEIKQRRAQGASIRVLAVEYGVSTSSVIRALRP